MEDVNWFPAEGSGQGPQACDLYRQAPGSLRAEKLQCHRLRTQRIPRASLSCALGARRPNLARHIFLSLGANRVREAFNEAQKNESSTGKLKSAGKTAQRAELVFPRGATLEDARAALDEWLQSKGITSQEIWIDNGSGLSRETRVTGRAMTQLLAAGWSGPYMTA